MPRRPRSHLPDGFFHITARGTGGLHLFRDDEDRENFLRLLRKVRLAYPLGLYAYCLMGTHYHLVVETRRDRLSCAMRWLNGLYSRGFNRRYGRRGHLFEERFSSWVIRDDDHLERTCLYVVENPVRAGLCSTVGEWRWSWCVYG